MRWWLVGAVLLAALVVAVVLGQGPQGPAAPPRLRGSEPAPSPADAPPTVTTTTTINTRVIHDCSGRAAVAAHINAASSTGLAWEPFHRAEVGWLIYAPLIAREIHVLGCGADTPAFADALATWQGAHGLPADGVFSGQTWGVLYQELTRRRPIALGMRVGCPAPPAPERLETIRVEEGYMGQAAQARPGVLAAYRRMVADARAADPQIAADPQALTIFSGYRDPARDALRCLTEGNCDGVRRARTCSPHRTGLALDITVGARPGGRVDSTEDANRLAQSRTPAYRWLVANADRYGFVPYPFEPWHWEWTGEAP